MPSRRVLHGSIDQLNRPYVTVGVPGLADPIIAFIDTGFNGALIIDEPLARRIGFVMRQGQHTSVRLAHHRDERFLLASGAFWWLGEAREVTALVTVESEEERRRRLRGRETEEVLVGTDLLVDCRLEIDFSLRSLTITR